MTSRFMPAETLHPSGVIKAMGPIVAIVGTRFQNFDVEREILEPLGVELRSGQGSTPDELLEIVEDADIVLAGANPKFDAAIIKRLRGRGIVRLGVGVDSVDIKAARQAGKWVAYVPDYGSESVALHAVALVMASLRRLPQVDAAVKSGSWGFSQFRPLHLPNSLCAGIYGYGKIGRLVAGHLTALGFDVAAADIDPRDPTVPILEPRELLQRSDVLSLHVPGHEAERPLIGEHELSLLPDGCIVVNTSRGSLIDTASLITALQNGKVGYAALDVFESEPPDIARFAEVLDRVAFTPHMSWYTQQSELDLRAKAARAALCILQGVAPDNFVSSPDGDRHV